MHRNPWTLWRWIAFRLNWNFFAGLLITAGTTLFNPAIDYGLLALHAHRRFKLSIPVLIISSLVGITALWSTDWLAPLMFVFRAVILASLIKHVRLTKSFVVGSSLMLAVQLGFVLYQFYGQDQLRPFGLSFNASNLGLTGFTFVAFPNIAGMFGALTLGLSQSRTYLAAAAILGLFGIIHRKKLQVGVVLLAGLTFIFITVSTPALQSRLNLDGINNATVRRNNLNIPPKVTIPVTPNSQPIPESSEVVSVPLIETIKQSLIFRPFGYGYRDYTHETGQRRPHNIFMVILYELGWLAIPFLAGIAYIVLRSAIPIWQYVVFVPSLFLTDEYFARPEGLYALALVVTFITRPRSGLGLARSGAGNSLQDGK